MSKQSLEPEKQGTRKARIGKDGKTRSPVGPARVLLHNSSFEMRVLTDVVSDTRYPFPTLTQLFGSEMCGYNLLLGPEVFD